MPKDSLFTQSPWKNQHKELLSLLVLVCKCFKEKLIVITNIFFVCYFLICFFNFISLIYAFYDQFYLFGNTNISKAINTSRNKHVRFTNPYCYFYGFILCN